MRREESIEFCVSDKNKCVFPLTDDDCGEFGMTRYSSSEGGNDPNDRQPILSEQERREDFQRHKEEMKKKPRRKKRTSSSLQSSTFQGEFRGMRSRCRAAVAAARKRFVVEQMEANMEIYRS